jgi:hypothetical protein
MPEDKDSLIAHYRQMRQALLAAIDGLSEDLLTEQSLDGWSVKDHLAHLAVWDDIRAGEIARISGGQSPAWPPIDEQQTNDFNAFIHGLREGLMDPALAQREGRVGKARWASNPMRSVSFAL